MNIDFFDVYHYSLELNQPLILHGQKHPQREGLILHLRSSEGAEGFGDVAPLPGFSKETLDEAREQVLTLQANLCGQGFPERLKKLDGAFDLWLDGPALKPSVRFGLESAVLNLLASAKHIPLYELIAKKSRTKVRITGLLAGSLDQIVAQTKMLLEKGFVELKLKVGSDIDEALAKVEAVNRLAYGKALLHLDVNQAWNFDQAVDFGKKIGCDAVNYIEEPFKDIRKIQEFFDETLIPVALDETVRNIPFDDIKSISGVDILVLKPTLIGGIEKTWQIITQAENFAMDAVISSSFESSLGIWTLANLAGIESHSGVAAGLDTLKWFKTDVLNPPISIQKGGIDICARTIHTNDINFGVLQKLQ